MSWMTDGLVIVDKPAGITSHDVVSRVRRLAGTRKVGHAGTLDPMATGVLVLGINKATRLLGHLLLTDKAYDATIRLGATTTTDDAEGDVVATASVEAVTETAIRGGLAAMVGNIEQRPSSVSAIKVDGKRAYDRVRAGEQVELKARPVRIDEIAVGQVRLVSTSLTDGRQEVEIDISVRCSSGTYVRAIARDLGESLGVGGHLTALRRTAVGPYDVAQAQTLEELADDFTVLPIAEAARQFFPVLQLDGQQATDVTFGRALAIDLDTLTAVFAPDGRFLALYEPKGEVARASAVFA